MKPTSKVIQLTPHGHPRDGVYIALCEDGSIWGLTLDTDIHWKLISDFISNQHTTGYSR